MKPSVTLAAALVGGTTVHGVLFPVPEAPYLVRWTSSELVDTNRSDPFNTTHLRRLMISRFTPVRKRDCSKTCRVPYMNAFIASQEDAIQQAFIGEAVEWPRGVLSSLEIGVCCKVKHATPYHGAPQPLLMPMLLFGTGLNTTRLFYSATAQQLASIGYDVIVMDHPYETDIVQFPSDGTIVYGGRIPADPNAIDKLNFALDVRARDASFVLDSLGVPKSRRVGFVGHSFGGPAAATAMYSDVRIAAGINLDGYMFGPAVERGAPGPFLIIGSTGHNSSSDDTWARFWNATIERRPRPWVKELSVVNSGHGTFSDFSLIGDVSGLRNNSQLVELEFGAFSGARAMEIFKAYLPDFFGFALKGSGEGLLAGPSDRFPEVEFLRTVDKTDQ